MNDLRFLGVSGHLTTGAPGHFETFHHGTFRAFSETLGNANVNFLGSRNGFAENVWFTPVIPNSFTSTVPWLPKKFLKSLIKLCNGKNGNVLIVNYEGNIYSLILLTYVARKSSRTYLYINLFNSVRYQRILRSTQITYMFKILLQFTSRSLNGRLILSADTHRMAELLEKNTQIEFRTYPMFSAFDKQKLAWRERNNILINVRGYKAEKFLMDTLKILSSIRRFNFEVHGIHSDEIANQLSEFESVHILKDQVSEVEYFESYLRYKRVVFLYDPGFFSLQSSGRLYDSILAGCQVIVPKNTSLEDVLLKYGNGSSYDFGDELSLATSLTSDTVRISPKEVEPPTNIHSAKEILNELQELVTQEKQDRNSPLIEFRDFILDEIAWAAITVLHLVFGVLNRLRRLLFAK